MSNNDDIIFMQPYGEDAPRDVSVLDLLNPNIDRASSEERKAHLDICKQCPMLQFGTRCSECGCIMQMKTWLRDAKCPLDKW